MRRNEPPLKFQESTHVSDFEGKVLHTGKCLLPSKETNETDSFSDTTALSQELGMEGLRGCSPQINSFIQQVLIEHMLGAGEQYGRMKPLWGAHHINGEQ